MFGFGFSEVLIILIIALIILGPNKLPEVAKMVGKAYAQFRRAFEDIKDSVDLDLNNNVPKKRSKNLDEIYKDKWQKEINTDKKDKDEKKDASNSIEKVNNKEEKENNKDATSRE
ncbi:MAG: Sec-independent protein translocase protein TatB [Deferribacterota bacterium]|nr:Sec-independent protein translocase protein TatB [Deferribacterota bacterium]